VVEEGRRRVVGSGRRNRDREPAVAGELPQRRGALLRSPALHGEHLVALRDETPGALALRAIVRLVEPFAEEVAVERQPDAPVVELLELALDLGEAGAKRGQRPGI